MSAPKKIYIEKHIENFDEFASEYNLSIPFKEMIVDVSDIQTSDNTTPYILESEHDRIVSELRKQHIFDLEQARFAYELQAINNEKQIEELRQKLGDIEQTVLLIKTSAQQKSWANEDRPMSEAVIEAEACIQVCDEILKQILK